jgi:hypothetical protein
MVIHPPPPPSSSLFFSSTASFFTFITVLASSAATVQLAPNTANVKTMTGSNFNETLAYTSYVYMGIYGIYFYGIHFYRAQKIEFFGWTDL